MAMAESELRMPFPDNRIAALRDDGDVSPTHPADATDGLALGWKPLIAITGLFWVYATISAVLFAYGLDATLATMTDHSLFAAWPYRVVQYVMLFPVLVGCYWLSLRRGWRPNRGRIASQLALAVAFALLAYPAMLAALGLLGHEEDTQKYANKADMWADLGLFATWLAVFTDFLVRYGFGLALVTGFAIYKRYRDIEGRAVRLERQFSEARLAALRMQLSPHTLFNLLHTIRGHIAWDPPAAQQMVVQLADLLRRLLNAGEHDFSRLADELQFVQLYLELQRRRFADRLTVALPAPDTLPEAWVPSLILQPLVENAVTHGLAGHAGPVRVELDIAAQATELRLRITNTIAGTGHARQEGIGLRNVRERLAVQFADAATLTSGPQPPDEWRAEICMPLLREPPREFAAGRAAVPGVS
jgi:hypothetical protein